MADLVIDLVDPKTISEKKEDPFLVHFENLRYNSVIPGRSLLQVYHPNAFKYAWQKQSRQGPKSVKYWSKSGLTMWPWDQIFEIIPIYQISMPSMALSSHWEFCMGILKLNVIRAPEMASILRIWGLLYFNLNLWRGNQDRFFYSPKKTWPSETKKMIPVRNR